MQLEYLAERISILLLAGILIGHYLDQGINFIKSRRVFGDNIISYVILQTVVCVFIVYMLLRIHGNYKDDFQNTFSGLFFVSMFYAMQTNYISNLQKLLIVF